jgi:ABC-2 type transport system permease protein
MKFMNDTWLLYKRNIRASLRNPVWIALGLFQPVLYLLLFAPLLKNLAGLPGFPQGGAFTVFTPGLLVMIALFGSAFVGFELVDHIRQGVLERLLVSPVSRLAILIGYVLRDITVLVVQSALLVVIALPMGLTANLLGVIVTFALLVLTGAVLASVSYALALLYRNEEALVSTLNVFTVPLLLLSGITLPLSFAPAIIQNIAKANPFSYEVTAARAMFVGHFGEQAIVVAFLFMGALTVLAFLWAARSFRRGVA